MYSAIVHGHDGQNVVCDIPSLAPNALAARLLAVIEARMLKAAPCGFGRTLPARRMPVAFT